MTDEVFEILDLAFPIMIQTISEEAEIAKRKLLSYRLRKMAERLSVHDWVKYGIFFFHKLKYHPDEQIISYLTNIGLDESQLRWFVPIEKVTNQFTAIEKEGIKINKVAAFILISHYLDLKFENEIRNHVYGTANHGGQEMSMMSKIFRQIHKRRKNAGGDLKYYKNPYDKINNELVRYIEQSSEMPVQLAQKFLDGKVEYITMPELAKCFHRPESMSIRDFHCHIYELLRIVMKDNKALIDESADDEIRDRACSWKVYQDRHVRIIFGID